MRGNRQGLPITRQANKRFGCQAKTVQDNRLSKQSVFINAIYVGFLCAFLVNGV